MFEYYVMNYDFNKGRIKMFNIFQNGIVSEWTEQAVRKYIRAPKKFKYIKQYMNPYLDTEEIAIYGFEGFCEELKSILRNQLWSRREYEISVSDAFVYEIRDICKELDKYTSLEDLKEELLKINSRNPKLEKWDCFDQCEKNIPIIAREVIEQYKKREKSNGHE